MTLLRLEGVSKRFGVVAALDAVDLAVEAGGRTAVVGPSGSGKSTLLRLVAGFETPDAGRVVLDGRTVAEPASITPTHRRSIGLVSQDGSLFPHLDVAGNVGFGLDRREDRDARVLALLDMVELERGMASRRPHELSGGQQQRVALARALARRPKLMLLDEPFSALDAGLRDALRRTVADLLAAEHVAALLVTHDRAEALGFADQLVVLRSGRVAQAGPPGTVYRQPSDPATAAFVGDAILLPAIGQGGGVVCPLGYLAAEGEIGDGPREVMIRPEQIRLATADRNAAPAGGRGRVVRIEFEGASSTVHVRLTGEPRAPSVAGGSGPDGFLVRVPVPSRSAPAPDDVVDLFVEGRGWVFPVSRPS